MIKNNEPYKIIVCGNAHSGKSIFINYLYRILPQKYTSLIRACPDGEGVWNSNQNNEQIQMVRKKGHFSEGIVKEIINDIEKETAPIVLIDTGGIRSIENKTIFTHADAFIVVSRDEVEEWETFGQELGLRKLAILNSEMNGKDKIEDSSQDYISGTITGLNRGNNVNESKILQQVAQMILKLVKHKDIEMKGKICAEDKETLNMQEAARALRMENINGNIKWIEEKGSLIYYYLKGFTQVRDRLKVFEARANWITGMVCEAAKENGIHDIELYDTGSNKYLKVKQLPQTMDEWKQLGHIQGYNILNEELQAYATENQDSILIHFEITNMHKLQLGILDRITLPKLDVNKKLYISGRLPMWLFASISLSYQNKEKSAFQPGNGFITYSSITDSNFGKKEQEIGIDISRFF